MSESALLPLLAFAGWSFLPNFISNIVQSVYYKIAIPVGRPTPQAGTHQYARDHRRIRIAVLTLYLLYTLLQSLYDIKLAGDFFTLLAVHPYSSSDKEIKSKFRRLAARFHPDKITSSANAVLEERYFIGLRLAADTLTTPSHRYLYTHFGPSILTHLPKPDTESGSSQQDKDLTTATLIPLALRARAPSYLLNLIFVIILNTFLLRSGSQHGKFWRYLIIAASFTLEFYLLTHDISGFELPTPINAILKNFMHVTNLDSLLPPHLLPFQLLQVSNKLAISLNIFISQISGLFPSMSVPMTGNTINASQLNQYLSSLNTALSQIHLNTDRLDTEAGSLLQLQFSPYKGQPEQVDELKRGMKEGMVMGTIKAHPEVQEALKNALRRRKEGVFSTTQSVPIGSTNDSHVSRRKDGADVVDLLESDEQFI